MLSYTCQHITIAAQPCSPNQMLAPIGYDRFARVWSRVQQDAAVDFGNPRILLLDDSTVWQPPQQLYQLWTYMRLLMLESIWVARCASESRPFSSAAVIMRFRAALQQQLTQDWLRTQ